MSAELIDTLINWVGEFWVAIPGLFLLAWFVVLVTGRSFISSVERSRDKPRAIGPTMGGILVIGSALVVYVASLAFLTALFYIEGNSPPTLTDILVFYAQFSLFPACVISFALLGLVDDRSKSRGNAGLHPRSKYLVQAVLACAFLAAAYYLKTRDDWGPYAFGQSLIVLFDGPNWLVGLALLFPLIACISNAVSFTDNLDGLATALSLQCGLALLFLGYFDWNQPETGHMEVTLFWAALAGACLAFLAYNKPGGKIRLGSSGALALGAALGAGVLLNGDLALLPFIGFVLLVELLSIPAQGVYFLLMKVLHGNARPLFHCLPLHRHLEMAGWSPWRILITFWLANLITSIIGLALWRSNLLPHFP